MIFKIIYCSPVGSLFTILTVAITILCTSSALAGEAIDSKAEVEKLMEELRAQKLSLEKKEEELEEQKKLLDSKLSKLEETLEKAKKLLSAEIGKKQKTETLAMISGRGTREVGTERKEESRQKPEVPAVAIDDGGVMLPGGRFVLEPSLQYSRTSALRVAVEGYTLIPAINVGLFDISEIDRDIVTAAITGRFGLTSHLELEAYIPYLWREDSTFGRPIGVGSASSVLNKVDGSGIGDIELAAHYQINDGNYGWPYFIGNLRYKAATGEGPFDVPTDPATGLQTEPPTGSGFHALQPSLTMLYPSDPAVFFMNLGYTWNMEDDVGGGNGDINPGDSINFGIGMGFSINDKTSFSLGYSHSIVEETEQNGVALANSDTLQVGSTSFGYSYQINERVGLNFNVATGVTDDAPDLQTTLRVPMKFDLY
jgi:hypothetical protein